MVFSGVTVLQDAMKTAKKLVATCRYSGVMYGLEVGKELIISPIVQVMSRHSNKLGRPTSRLITLFTPSIPIIRKHSPATVGKGSGVVQVR